MQTRSLKELDNNLPIPLSGKTNNSFEFKSWGLEEEKLIGEIKRKAQYMGPFISEVLSIMLTQCCGEDFQAMDKGQRMYFLHQMPLNDVLYMWIYLRYDQLDENIKLTVSCPGCGRMNDDFIASLSGLDVKCIEEKDEEIDTYNLRKTFKLDQNDAEEIKVIKFKRTPWGAMDKADDEVTTNEGLMMGVMFKSSIVGTDQEEGFIDADLINTKLRKADIEHLSSKIAKHNAGPALAVEGKCKFCPTKFYRQLDWSYDFFFGSSSIPSD